MTATLTRIALRSASRFNTLASATSAARRQPHWTPVLLGDDGLYWVPGTNREAGLLIAAGYECAE